MEAELYNYTLFTYCYKTCTKYDERQVKVILRYIKKI